MLDKAELKPQVTVQSVEDLIAELEQKGLKIDTSQPVERPQIPPNVGELTGTQLAELLAQLTAYKSFVSTQFALEKARLNQYANEMEMISSEILRQLPRGIPDKEKKAYINSNPLYIDANRRYLNQKNKVELIEKAILKPVQRDIDTVSRVIAVWESDNDNHRRMDNAGKGRSTPQILGRYRRSAS